MAEAVPASSAGAIVPSLVVLLLIVLILVRRTYYLIHGSVYSTGRIFAWGVFGVLVFLIFAASTLYTAIGTWGEIAWVLVAPYAGVVVATAILTTPIVRRVVRFERRPDGSDFYRLPWLVPVLYLVLFTARFGLELAVFGVAAFSSVALPTQLPTALLLLVIAFDLLYAVSLGLVFGRGIGVMKAHDAWVRTQATTSVGPGTPLP